MFDTNTRGVLKKTTTFVLCSLVVPGLSVPIFGALDEFDPEAQGRAVGALLSPIIFSFVLVAIGIGVWAKLRRRAISWKMFALAYLVGGVFISALSVTSCSRTIPDGRPFVGISKINSGNPKVSYTVLLRDFSERGCRENSDRFFRGFKKACPNCTLDSLQCITQSELDPISKKVLLGERISDNYVVRERRLFMVVHVENPKDSIEACEQAAKNWNGQCVKASTIITTN